MFRLESYDHGRFSEGTDHLQLDSRPRGNSSSGRLTCPTLAKYYRETCKGMRVLLLKYFPNIHF